jgi:hypothetical protein
VSTNKYYASIDVLPKKMKEGKGKGLLHLEIVNQNLSSDDGCFFHNPTHGTDA